MMGLRLILGTLAAALLAGCSQLAVRVEVLDPGYAHRVVADGALQVVYFDLQRFGASEASRPVREAAEKIVAAVEKLAQGYDALGAALPKEATQYRQSASTLRTSIAAGGTANERALNAARELDTAGALALRTAHDLQWRYDQAMPPELRRAMESIQTLRRQYGQDSEAEVRQAQRQAGLVEQKLSALSVGGAATLAGISTPAKAAAQQLTSIVNVDLKSLIGGGSLASSEYAYIVAKAPDSYWATSFNRASASGTFGDSDFVIKMNSLGDFTVKGMRFDASTVAKVASKVATQALLIGAQMAGVPLPSSGTPATGDGAKLADASGVLASNDATMARRKASFDAWRQAVREMASAVLAEDATLRTVSPTWAADKAKVVTPITTSLSALSPVLSLDNVQ